MKQTRVGLLLLVVCLVPGQVVAWTLQPTTTAVSYQDVLQRGVRSPDWSNGSAIRIDGDPSSANQVRTVSRDGTVRTTTVILPGATRLSLRHAAVAKDGGVVVAGSAMMRNGAEQYFIARIGHDGVATDSVSTGTFAPHCVCPSPDGSVWVVGKDHRAEERGENFALVSHYTFQKGLIGQALDANPFSRSFEIMASYAAADTTSSWLRCDSKRAYVYSNRTDELIEIDARTHALSRWPIVSSGKVVALANTASGELFANLVAASDPMNDPPALSLFVLEKDHASSKARWVVVRASGLALWGADGEQLVLADDPSSHAVRWFDVTRME